MDSPELTRYAVLLAAIVAQLVEASGLDRNDPGMKAILQETDALTMRLAHRSRSAVDYHLSERGKAALEDAAAAAPAIYAGDLEVQLEQRRWSQEQADGPIYPGMEKGDVIRDRRRLSGVRLMSSQFQGEPEKKRRN